MQQQPLKNRLVTVDALRGFALLGIMLAHFIYWYTAGPLPQDVYTKYKDIGSQVTQIFNELFITGKFFTFFSFLFGLSFYLQMRGLENNPQTFVARYAWRLVLLMVIGVCHHAMWQGDILSIYVPLGFVLLALRKLSNKWILVLGILLALNVPGKLVEVVKYFTTVANANQNPGGFEALTKAYHDVITKGTWIDIFKYNLQHFVTKFEFQVNSGRIYITLGFFMLGTFVGRKKWFENVDAFKPLIKKICKRSALFMCLALVCGLGMFAIDAVLKLGWQQNPIAGFVFNIFYDILNASMVVFFVSGLTILMYRKRGQRFFYPLAAVGKMALTSYITQTVFGLLLFYNVGLGLFAKTSPGLNYLIAIGFFVLQVAFSKWYLRHFIYGPLEWLWRSGTMLKWQPLLKKSATKESGDIPYTEAPAVVTVPVEVK
jgi:uncharacterized protein